MFLSLRSGSLGAVSFAMSRSVPHNFRRNAFLMRGPVHTTSEHKALAKKMSDAVGRPLLEHDGMGDFWVHKYEDFEAAFLDAEYQETIRPDELKLIDMDSIAVTVGVEYVVIDDGKVVDKHQWDI